MAHGRVLVIEDDDDLRRVLVRGLDEEGFDTVAVASGSAALERLEHEDADVLVVDIGLPDTDGRDLVQALRARGADVPALFLTARDTLTDRLTSFNAGGDDFVAKPFAFAELVVRLQALVRRAGGASSPRAGGLTLDPSAHAAFVEDNRIPLTPTEFRLLARLVAAPGSAVRRQELIRTAWPHGAYVHPNTLDAYIARLRRKLEPFEGAPRIATLRGVGYSVE
jgi:two-component system response regulator MprA